MEKNKEVRLANQAALLAAHIIRTHCETSCCDSCVFFEQHSADCRCILSEALAPEVWQLPMPMVEGGKNE